MLDTLAGPWPWYIAGPLIGLMVPLLLLLGNKQFGVSGNLRHICAAICPRDVAFFHYDWKRTGAWNLTFAAGILVGGFLAGWLFANPAPVAISTATEADLARLGVHDLSTLVPRELFNWTMLTRVPGLVLIVLGGFLVGFGTAYGGGCTSGHAVAGLAQLQLPSLIAVIAFFAGGLFATHFLLPLIL